MLWNLISKNPFNYLQQHMAKTHMCVEKTKTIFEKLFNKDKEGVKLLAKEISQLEHECDKIKQEMRMMVANSIFLPIDRRDLLQVLSNMDAIADSAEDVGVLLTMRWMELDSNLHEPFNSFLVSSIKVVEEAEKVILAMDKLLEAGFSGPERDEVTNRLDYIDKLEHEADKLQDRLGKKIFENEEKFSAASLIMWIKIIDRVGNMANCAERMGNHIRLMLASK